MSVKWKLFGIANYLLLLFYTGVFVFAMRAFLNPESGMRHLQGARLITLCILVVALNAGFNIFIFHRHLPANPPDLWIRRIYWLSTLFSSLSFALLLYYFVPDAIGIESSPHDRDFNSILPFALIILPTFFVLTLQFAVLKVIDKKSKERMIDDLGNNTYVD